MIGQLSINDAASRLGVAPAEVIDASGLTLGELEHLAELDGFDPCQYRQVPVLTDHDMKVIATSLARS